MPTVHIEAKKEDIAKIVLMPGDPKRAEYIAKKYLKDAKVVNLIRKMSAYTGYYNDKLVTVFPSGMGIPSMGIYSYELFKEYDVDTIIRIGSMGAYVKELGLKDIILVNNSVSNSTYAKMMDGYDKIYVPSNQLVNNVIINTANVRNIKIKQGNIYSSDVFYEQNNDYVSKVKNYNVCGVEMETFALFTNARILGKKASALLTVSDTFFSDDKLSAIEREQNLDNMIILALEASLKL